MRVLRLQAILGVLTTVMVLAGLSMTVEVGLVGWGTGLAAGLGITGFVVLGRSRGEDDGPHPADWVTLGRGVLAAGVAALVAAPADRPASTTALVLLASVALALDAVDGRLARRTATVTPFGARLDGEVDAFLILVLSVQVSRGYGAWVLAIGAARYAFLVAGWPVRWLAAPLPARSWRKVVAAVQGIVLTVAIAGLLPRAVGMVAVGVALLLLAESFGRDVVWLYRNHAGARARVAVRWAAGLLATAVVWAALVAPDRLERLTPAAFARIPLEGLVLVAVCVPLPRRPRRVVAAVAGVLFGVLTVVKVLDVGFFQELGRPFDPVLDWGNLGPAVGVVRDSLGESATVLLVGGAVLGLVLLVAVVTAATLHVASVAARQRRRTAGAVAVLASVWAVCAAMSLQLTPAGPVASTSTVGIAVAQARDAEAAVRDQQRFETAIHSHDPYATLPAPDLLSGLRGKDVLVVFVESYGQVAVQGTDFSRGVDAVLRSGTATLARAGFAARSAFLDSPTFGGISWLAHSTLQSGLWVDNQQRYDQLMGSDRLTLSAAFRKAGWRTVSDIPADDRPWPQGTSFYHYEQFYDRRNVGYRGPHFSYAPVPDQYTLAAFQHLELAPGHAPVMAEIDLVSSHTPWTPLPRLVPWNRLGNGTVFGPMPAQGLTPAVAWRDPDTVRRLYGQSVRYSWQSLVSWIARLHDRNLVMVVLGDHQPNVTVSGPGANHRVPVSIVAADPAVLHRVGSWQWQAGLLPSPAAPVWPMDAFRDRFLAAFGTGARSGGPAR